MTTRRPLRLFNAGKDTTKAADAGRNDSPNEEAENQSVGVERRRRFIVYVVWYGGGTYIPYHTLNEGLDCEVLPISAPCRWFAFSFLCFRIYFLDQNVVHLDAKQTMVAYRSEGAGACFRCQAIFSGVEKMPYGE